MTVFFRVSVIAALLLGLAGCVSLDSYPDHWAGYDRERSTCAGIAGRYRDIGEGPDGPLGGWGFLSSHLFKYPEGKQSDTIEISHEPGLLRVRGLKGGTVVAERILSAEADGLECHDDGVNVNSHAGLTGEPIVGLATDSTTLRRATDGALILEHRDGGVGLLFLLVPMVGVRDSLYRFPAVR